MSKIWFWADSIENSFSYKTVEGIFHISLSCRCKILKINIYSIIHLRILIVCRYQSICLSLWSSIPTLKLKYFDINRWSMLCFILLRPFHRALSCSCSREKDLELIDGVIFRCISEDNVFQRHTPPSPSRVDWYSNNLAT